MSLVFFGHPFSSYCQKALIPLYESGAAFTFRLLDQGDPETFAEFKALWPMGRFPLLVDQGRPIAEATIIIEHLDIHHPGPARMVPEDPAAELEVRFLDRFFDNYVHTPLQKLVSDGMRPEGGNDAIGTAQARVTLDAAYAWLEPRLQGREWVAGEGFSLADCSAAPALFYADWAHPIGEAFPNVRAYRSRLNARPSFARAIDGGRPYRHYFPLGAPDRD